MLTDTRVKCIKESNMSEVPKFEAPKWTSKGFESKLDDLQKRLSAENKSRDRDRKRSVDVMSQRRTPPPTRPRRPKLARLPKRRNAQNFHFADENVHLYEKDNMLSDSELNTTSCSTATTPDVAFYNPMYDGSKLKLDETSKPES